MRFWIGAGLGLVAGILLVDAMPGFLGSGHRIEVYEPARHEPAFSHRVSAPLAMETSWTNGLVQDMSAMAMYAALAAGVFLVVILALVAIALVARRLWRREDMRSKNQEAKLIQEIHHGLGRMEDRIEALETLLFERGGRRGPSTR